VHGDTTLAVSPWISSKRAVADSTCEDFVRPVLFDVRNFSGTIARLELHLWLLVGKK
jgi:hypothetical protein